jgi:hypothetical protein
LIRDGSKLNESTGIGAGTDPVIDEIRSSIPEDKPDWTENLCWTMHDPRSGISLYGHLGRMQPNRAIWEGLSLIYLPNGQLLVNRSLGVSVAAARNAEYDYRPLVPLKLWRYCFEGVAQRVDPRDLRTRPLGDEPFEAVSYDLIWESLQPVYDMHNSERGSERMHLEHGGTVKGAFTIGGQRVTVNCTGYRDHSVSQRTFTTLNSETWAHCAFPSGKVFSILEVSRVERQVLHGQVYENGRMLHATPQMVPDLDDSSGRPHHGVIRAATEKGEVEVEWQTIDGRFVPFNLLEPVGMRPGIDRSRADAMVAVQCPARFVWDGEGGYGWLERTRPLRALQD